MDEGGVVVEVNDFVYEVFLVYVYDVVYFGIVYVFGDDCWVGDVLYDVLFLLCYLMFFWKSFKGRGFKGLRKNSIDFRCLDF